MQTTNHYQNIKLLGAGRYGEAWLVYDNITKQLKVLKREIGIRTRAGKYVYQHGKAFQNESEINNSVYGFGELHGDPHDATQQHSVVMNYFEGMTLCAYLDSVDNRNRSPIAYNHASGFEVMRIFVLAAMSLSICLHEKRLVHNDLTLYNAIISPDFENVSVIDFGCAKKIGVRRSDCNLPTSLRNKHPQLPPETFHDTNKYTVFSAVNQDIWGVGYQLQEFLNSYKNCEPKPSIEKVNELVRISNRLRAENPLNRASIRNSICQVISCCFQQGIYSVPITQAECFIIISALFQLRINALQISIGTAVLAHNAKQATRSVENRAQIVALVSMRNALMPLSLDAGATFTSIAPQAFFETLHNAILSGGALIPIADSLRLIQKLMSAFFPTMKPTALPFAHASRGAPFLNDAMTWPRKKLDAERPPFKAGTIAAKYH